MSSKIKPLPEEIRNKIAAGEVIERPASVIKELLENAFDACASEIKIEFTKGGLEKIIIYDNGEGMSPEDLRLCYKPFATSKIHALQDIFNLQTYGFRGEALASIAQVSRLKIISKEKKEELSFEILVEFGKEKSFKPAQLKEGTLVEVRDLFENLPARKAFLKSIKAERAKNLELIKALMLTHPEIKFSVKIDGEEVFNWRGGSEKELFSYLYEIPKENLVESTFRESFCQIDLLLTNKNLLFSHGRFLYVFVNNRLIKDEKLTKIIYYVFKKFYGNLGLPAGIIKITMPSSLIDFNVHPAKWEVRFKKEKEVYSYLESAIAKHQSLKKIVFTPEIKTSISEAGAFAVKEDLPMIQYYKNHFYPSKERIIFQEEIPSFKVVGSFLNTYILVEKGDDLYIVDQHALAERIHFEELTSKEFFLVPQRLLLPFLIKLTPEMEDTLEEKLKILEKLGFEMEVMGKGELLVKACPSELIDEAKEVIEKLLEFPQVDFEEVKKELFREIACKMARKKGDFLTTEEKYYLVSKMFQRSLETCPHERPIFFKISLHEIEKKLKRKL
ncbi:MAG: DNA mismatch repair endonuclease MutL [Caldimicrobium sp.]